MQNCSKLLCSKYSEEKEDKNRVWYKQESGFGWPLLTDATAMIHSHDIYGSGDSKKKCVEKCIHEHRRFCTKASDVQHTDEVSRRVEGEALVDPGDHMIEETTVDSFSQSITSTAGLLHLQRNPTEDNKLNGYPLDSQFSCSSEGVSGSYLMAVPLMPPAVVSMTLEVRLTLRSSSSRPNSSAQNSKD